MGELRAGEWRGRRQRGIWQGWRGRGGFSRRHGELCGRGMRAGAGVEMMRCGDLCLG